MPARRLSMRKVQVVDAGSGEVREAQILRGGVGGERLHLRGSDAEPVLESRAASSAPAAWEALHLCRLEVGVGARRLPRRSRRPLLQRALSGW